MSNDYLLIWKCCFKKFHWNDKNQEIKLLSYDTARSLMFFCVFAILFTNILQYILEILFSINRIKNENVFELNERPVKYCRCGNDKS